MLNNGLSVVVITPYCVITVVRVYRERKCLVIFAYVTECAVFTMPFMYSCAQKYFYTTTSQTVAAATLDRMYANTAIANGTCCHFFSGLAQFMNIYILPVVYLFIGKLSLAMSIT